MSLFQKVWAPGPTIIWALGGPQISESVSVLESVCTHMWSEVGKALNRNFSEVLHQILSPAQDFNLKCKSVKQPFFLKTCTLKPNHSSFNSHPFSVLRLHGITKSGGIVYLKSPAFFSLSLSKQPFSYITLVTHVYTLVLEWSLGS